MTHQEQNKHSSFLSFLFGAVLGGLIGAGVAILWAPQSGEQTRLQIQKTTQDIQTKAEQTISSAKEHSKRAADEIARHAEVIKDEVQQAVDTAVKEGKETISDTKKIAKESNLN